MSQPYQSAQDKLRARFERMKREGLIDVKFDINFQKLGGDENRHDALLESLQRVTRGEYTPDPNTAKAFANYPGTAEMYAARLLDPKAFVAGTLGTDFDGPDGMPSFLHLHTLEDFDVLAQGLPENASLREQLTRLQAPHAMVAKILHGEGKFEEVPDTEEF